MTTDFDVQPTAQHAVSAAGSADELPIRVHEAAIFLGVSMQTVYLWVERKQIPISG